ncbi:MAG: family 78 glycoside hydrolase catalytic domain, partial [Victivallales bacterium]|nr:family 78 glycoside hydrolase catalytic domain [Victivallales bacterium]
MKTKEKSQTFKIYDLRVMSSLAGRVFIDSGAPDFSWKIASGRPGFRQRAYRLKAASKPELLGAVPDLWDSGYVESGNSSGVRWQGKELASRARCYWTVTVWDENGNFSESEEKGIFEVALLNNSDWHAQWIYSNSGDPAVSSPCPYFRREFQAKEQISSARLYISARGLFEAAINGKRVGKDYFVPGWTNFSEQIQYMTYDVTELLQKGANAIGVVLGDGWYCGTLSNQRKRNHYGKYPELLVRLELFHRDGTKAQIVTDSTWKTSTGPILYSDIYDGEMYDAGYEMPGWDTAGFDDSKWSQVQTGVSAAESPLLTQKCCPPVRRMMEIKPVKILNPQKDVYIWDFGQNISGWIKLRIKGNARFLHTIKFGEMLNPDGSLYNLNYRSARSTDYYICSGSPAAMSP